MEFVYVLKSNLKDIYKIGYTRAPRRRIVNIRCDTPDAMFVKIYAGTMEDERVLHKIFSKYRVKGEWFRLNYKRLLRIDRYFIENKSNQLHAMRELALFLANGVHVFPKRVVAKEPKDITRYSNPQSSMTELEAAEIRKLKISVRTGQIVKAAYESKPNQKTSEVAALSGFSIRTVRYVLGVLENYIPHSDTEDGAG